MLSRNPDWRTEDEMERTDRLGEEADRLADFLVDKGIHIQLAMAMGLGEEAVEAMVDDIWDGLRRVAMDEATVDVVLELAFRSVAEQILRGTESLMARIGIDILD